MVRACPLVKRLHDPLSVCPLPSDRVRQSWTISQIIHLQAEHPQSRSLRTVRKWSTSSVLSNRNARSSSFLTTPTCTGYVIHRCPSVVQSTALERDQDKSTRTGEQVLTNRINSAGSGFDDCHIKFRSTHQDPFDVASSQPIPTYPCSTLIPKGERGLTHLDI